MKAFVMHLHGATQHEKIEGVSSFVGQDDSGSFGIQAGHARMMTALSYGLARYRDANDAWVYLALPGGLLYIHARLLERSTCLAARCGGGSMTALPIVETEQGEIAAYIPTNLISITDGQIYMDGQLFARGFLPALDVTKSVSRIGGKAQHPAIKAEAGRMKLDYLQFLELEVFTRFGSRLEASMEARIKRGQTLRELMKQDRLSPLPIEFEMAWLVAHNEGLFDGVGRAQLSARLERLRQQVASSGLTLTDSREQWRNAVRLWLAEDEHEPPA